MEKEEKLAILYLSAQIPNPSGGPHYSIPAQVKAQAEVDNVLWVNFVEDSVPLWENTGVFKSIADYRSFSFESLPAPFDHPDLVIFEDFYIPFMIRMHRLLRRNAIPYIIVPRGSLTSGAQALKHLKKVLGNFVFFHKFARDAAAIQYLTEKERDNSGEYWNTYSLVIPNGVTIPQETHKVREKAREMVFIGRYNIFHKGLDILLDACAKNRDLLLKNECRISLYGYRSEQEKKDIEERIKTNNLAEVMFAYPPIFNEDKQKLLRNSDVFVLTSRFEGLPMGLLEAMSFGLPCLITEGSNMKQEVDAARAGWTAETNAESLSEAIRNMLTGDLSVSEASRNAAELAKNYDWDSLAEKAHGEYLKLLGKK